MLQPNLYEILSSCDKATPTCKNQMSTGCEREDTNDIITKRVVSDCVISLKY